MKKELLEYLKQIANQDFNHSDEKAEQNDDYDYGYNIGWKDAEISLARRILAQAQIEEITA